MIGEGDCGAVGGMKIGRGNRSTQRILRDYQLFTKNTQHEINYLLNILLFLK
jgi:hypothetical protein